MTDAVVAGDAGAGLHATAVIYGESGVLILGPSGSGKSALALALLEDVESAFYLHLEVTDRPGVLAAVTQVLGEQEVSVKSFVHRGHGAADARTARAPVAMRLVMVVHPLPESRLQVALERLGELDFVRSAPRAIRVIEEEFI